MFFLREDTFDSDGEVVKTPDECGPDEALQAAADMLVDWKLASVTVTATHVCKLCFWLSKAGLGGPISDLSVHPERSSGQYSKHFDLVVGTRRCDTDGDDYWMKSPCYLRAESKRSAQDLCVWTPLESAEEEVRTNPGIHKKLAVAIEAGDLPQAYFDHPVKQRAPPNTSVLPYVLYIDGIAFQRTDGLLRFSVISLVTGISHLNAVLRKSELCACGCAGWCTIFGILLMVKWSFESLARGRWFRSRHDNGEWLPSDHKRAARADTLLGFIALLLYCKEAVSKAPQPLTPQPLSPSPLRS